MVIFIIIIINAFNAVIYVKHVKITVRIIVQAVILAFISQMDKIHVKHAHNHAKLARLYKLQVIIVNHVLMEIIWIILQHLHHVDNVNILVLNVMIKLHVLLVKRDISYLILILQVLAKFVMLIVIVVKLLVQIVLYVLLDTTKTLM